MAAKRNCVKSLCQTSLRCVGWLAARSKQCDVVFIWHKCICQIFSSTLCFQRPSPRAVIFPLATAQGGFLPMSWLETVPSWNVLWIQLGRFRVSGWHTLVYLQLGVLPLQGYSHWTKEWPQCMTDKKISKGSNIRDWIASEHLPNSTFLVLLPQVIFHELWLFFVCPQWSLTSQIPGCRHLLARMNFQMLSTMFAYLFGFLGSSSRYSNMAVCLKAACKTEVVISLQHILKRSLSRSCANRVGKGSPSECNKLTKT